MFELAERLGKTVGELEGMPPGRGMSETEFKYWASYDSVRARELERAKK